jgi:DNA invertase Pin-like site-specific DNA recombinase
MPRALTCSCISKGSIQHRRVARPCFFAEFERSIIQERVRAGLRRAKAEGKQLGRPRIAPALDARILAALKAPGRTEGVRKIAKRFGVDPGTVQRISRPFDGASVAA